MKAAYERKGKDIQLFGKTYWHSTTTKFCFPDIIQRFCQQQKEKHKQEIWIAFIHTSSFIRNQKGQIKKGSTEPMMLEMSEGEKVL